MQGLKREERFVGPFVVLFQYKAFLWKERKTKARGHSIHVPYVSLIPRGTKNLTRFSGGQTNTFRAANFAAKKVSGSDVFSAKT